MTLKPSSFPLIFGDASIGPDTGFYFFEPATGIFFDNVRLVNPMPFDQNLQPVAKEVILQSGKHSVQLSDETAIAASFNCTSAWRNDVTRLEAKIGMLATLRIDNDYYENCYINSFSWKLWAIGVWVYSVGFAQDTTS